MMTGEFAGNSDLGAQIGRGFGLAPGWNAFTRPGECRNAQLPQLPLTLARCPTLAARGSETVFWESGRKRDERRSVGVLFPAAI